MTLLEQHGTTMGMRDNELTNKFERSEWNAAKFPQIDQTRNQL